MKFNSRTSCLEAQRAIGGTGVGSLETCGRNGVPGAIQLDRCGPAKIGIEAGVALAAGDRDGRAAQGRKGWAWSRMTFRKRAQHGPQAQERAEG